MHAFVYCYKRLFVFLYLQGSVYSTGSVFPLVSMSIYSASASTFCIFPLHVFHELFIVRDVTLNAGYT